MLNKGSDLIQAFQILNSEGGEGEDSRSTMGASRHIKWSHPTAASHRGQQQPACLHQQEADRTKSTIEDGAEPSSVILNKCCLEFKN